MDKGLKAFTSINGENCGNGRGVTYIYRLLMIICLVELSINCKR